LITLDSKPLRTPVGNTILVPPRLATLAYLIGAEWNVVTTGSVRQHTLPLTSLVCRAIDQLTPNSPKEIRESVIDDLLRYLDTDAILFFAPQHQAEGTLLRMQMEEWTPLIKWALEAFGTPIHSRSGEVGIGQFAHQPEETKKAFRTWMEKYQLLRGELM
jgi:ATP synthase mitochondrial F1 complex assembly factor 2